MDEADGTDSCGNKFALNPPFPGYLLAGGGNTGVFRASISGFLYDFPIRIAYCAHVRLPSERAHGHQIAQVCDALVRLGHDVTLLVPARKTVILEDFHTYYHAEKAVQVQYVRSFDQHVLLKGGWVFGLWLSRWSLRRAFKKKLSNAQFDLLYTRSPALLPVLLRSATPVVLELHQLPRRKSRAFVRLCNKCALVACLTSPIRDKLLRWGVAASRLLVAGDAVDLRRFGKLPSTEEARTLMNVQTGRTVVGYVGRLKTLGMEKGVADLLRALRMAQDTQQFFGLIVGGPQEDTEQYYALAKTLGLTDQEVLFTGNVPAAMVPTALAACDVLVMPFPDEPHYRKYMSPLKMFEYMASGKPIITSDLPPVRDVLSEKTAVFCQHRQEA